MYVGRLAPSPTGALHLGNARTFMIAYARARQAGGRLIMRMEDLDHPKDKPGAAKAAIEDLKWLGFEWDEEYTQSERIELYRDAAKKLIEKGLLYPCVCSRKDVENAQSAPHAGEQLFYPGLCRGKFASWDEAEKAISPRKPCWRFKVAPNTCVSFVDNFAGPYSQEVDKVLGDFPVARDKDGAGYTLAVVVDDLAMGVTEVVRGDDLLPATPAQMLIAKSLLQPSTFSLQPSYCHVPLVVGPDGRRLAKRHGDTRIASYRESGLSAEHLIGFLASSLGCAENGEKISLETFVERFDLSKIDHSPCKIDFFDTRTAATSIV